MTLRGVMPGSFPIAPQWLFAFDPCAAQPVSSETEGEAVMLTILPGDGSPDAGGGTDPGGCCRVGGAGGPGDGVLAALVVLGLVRRRRRP
jgi:MYXO-CTERM domain-containing protein